MAANRLDPRLIDSPPWLVRIFDPERLVVGVGFLIDDVHVLTCARVVVAALHIGADNVYRKPNDFLELDFPNAREHQAGGTLSRRATVVAGGWFPKSDDGTGDIAILSLDVPVNPLAITPAPLRRAGEFVGRPFSVRGCPTDSESILATGTLGHRAGPDRQWVEIEDMKLGSPAGSQSFSGSPVLATDLEAVVGIMVAEWQTPLDEKAGHVIPLEVIVRYWPPLDRAIRWRLDLDPDLAAYWLPEAKGSEPEAKPEGWYFTGRQRVLAELSDWLAHPPESDHRIRLVTGAPGVGKSAILARLTLLADPFIGPAIQRADLDAIGHPLTVPIGLAFRVRGQTLEEVVLAIASAAGIEATSPLGLVAAMRGRAGLFTIVVDDLDEAVREEVFGICRLLSDLAHQCEGVRILGAVRSGAEVGSITDAHLGLGSDVLELAVDRPPYMHKDDLAEYARRRLMLDSSPLSATPYRGRLELATAVANSIADRAYPSFLIAQLIAQTLVTRSRPVDTPIADWENIPISSIDATLDRLIEELPGDVVATRDLLTALAFAEGDGLRPGLWARLATALSGREYDEKDVAAVVGSAASLLAARLSPASGEARSGDVRYRLFHQQLDDHLRGSGQPAARQGEIVDALVASVQTNLSGERKWESAEPYVIKHLASHAAAAGRLDELLVDPGFLACVDVDELLILLPQAKSPEAIEAAATFRAAFSKSHGRSIAERASYFELAARQRGSDHLADRLANRFPNRRWEVLAALWKLGDSETSRHPTEIGSVALAQLHGRPIAVGGGRDGTIRLWDFESRATIGQPLMGHQGSVEAVAVGTLSGRAVAVSGGSDGTIRLWDIESGAHIGEPLRGHAGWIWAVTAGTMGGRAVAVSGGGDGTVRLWDLESRVQLGEPLIGHVGSVWDVALRTLGGRPIAVSGGGDGTVRLWDLKSSVQVGELLESQAGSIEAVALRSLRGRMVAMSASDSGKIQLWDLGSQTLVASLEGHQGPVTSVVLGTLDGRTVAASGGWDGTIRLWDLKPPRQVAIVDVHSRVLGLATSGRLVVAACDDGLLAIEFHTSGRAQREAQHMVSSYPLLSPVEFGQLIGSNETDAPEKAALMRERGEIIAVPSAGGYSFPAFQVDPVRRRVWPIVIEINEALDAKRDPWGAASWWYSVDPRLGVEPYLLLGTERQHELVVAAKLAVAPVL